MEIKDKEQYGYVLGELTAVLENAYPRIEDGHTLKGKNICMMVVTQPSKIDLWVAKMAKADHSIVKGVTRDDLIATINRYYDLSAKIDRKTYDNASGGCFWLGYHQFRAKRALLVTRQRIGNQIKEAREAKGLSQEELAVSVGIKGSDLASIEDGYLVVDSEYLTKIADTLGLKIKFP